LSDASTEDLNTIRVILEWGRCRKLCELDEFTNPKDKGPIHERAMNKGNESAAILGEPRPSHKADLYEFEPDDNLDSLMFVFRYAPEGELLVMLVTVG
jgi:hypothetical protein